MNHVVILMDSRGRLLQQEINQQLSGIQIPITISVTVHVSPGAKITRLAEEGANLLRHYNLDLVLFIGRVCDLSR